MGDVHPYFLLKVSPATRNQPWNVLSVAPFNWISEDLLCLTESFTDKMNINYWQLVPDGYSRVSWVLILHMNEIIKDFAMDTYY